MTVLLCGIPSETPLRMVAEELDALAVPYVTFNQRRFASTEIEWEIADGRVDGSLSLDGETFRLSDFSGIYTRLMDDGSLPELSAQPAHSAQRIHARSVHDALMRWTEVAPTTVVNRAGPMSSNFSKPYQAQLIREQGFSVPETLVTNEPSLVEDFLREKGRVIYKSISGVRSIVQTFQDADLERLGHIRWCPTQFQAFVEGTNVRVHTIAGRVFATAINSLATDYRYARHQVDEPAELVETRLSAELADRCLQLANALGLEFAGIDLKITPDGEAFCFEVNPSPAFSFYELNTGQPIARAVARHLAGMTQAD